MTRVGFVRMALVLVALAATACASWSPFGRHYRWWYINTLVVEPPVLAVNEVAVVTVTTGEDIPPDSIQALFVLSPKVSATAGSLYITYEEAQAGTPNDPTGWSYYPAYDPFNIRLDWGTTNTNTVFWRAPAEPQVVTITAEYHTVTRSTTVNVVGGPVL